MSGWIYVASAMLSCSRAARKRAIDFAPLSMDSFGSNAVSSTSKRRGFLHIAWIGLAGSGLTALLTRMRMRAELAAVAGMLWVLHPAQVEVYGWASTRIDAMAAAFGLFGLAALLGRKRILAGILLLLAFASKESSWPLVLAAPVLLIARGHRGRDLLLGSLPGIAGIGLILLLKWILLGGILPPGVEMEIPLSARLQGLLSYFEPLLLRPVGSEAVSSPWRTLLGLLFAIPLLGLATLGLLRALLGWKTHPRASRRGLALVLALVLCFGLCLAISGGVPVRDDLAGGRVWFLPSAFLVAALMALPTPRGEHGIALLGAMLLIVNLGPYSDASERMRGFLRQMDQAMAEHGHAVRVRGLSEYHGPVPLFALMNFVYMQKHGGEDIADRPLLSMELGDPQLEDRAYQDALWRAYHQSKGHSILELRWDDEAGRLVEITRD
jgi:hypothetical protein